MIDTPDVFDASLQPAALLAHSGFDEETARAEIYGLLAQLFYAPPTPEFIAELQISVTDAPVTGGYLEEPWRQLVGAATWQMFTLMSWRDRRMAALCDAIAQHPKARFYAVLAEFTRAFLTVETQGFDMVV